MMRAFLLMVAFAALGCGRGATPQAATRPDEHHGHDHERDKMLLADFGRYHAGLTAHLSSKTGNELDVLVESMDAAHKPVALPLEKFTAKARTATGVEHELSFEPAEMDERKDDPPGKCSHFTAKAPWMKADAPLTIAAEIPLDGRPHTVTWKEFVPRKYAHVVE
jgi:hypothetical protein